MGRNYQLDLNRSPSKKSGIQSCDGRARSPRRLVINVSSPPVPLVLDIDFELQLLSPAPPQEEFADPPQRIPQVVIRHRSARFSKVAHREDDLVAIGEHVRVDKDALGHEHFASTLDNLVESDAHGQGNGAEDLIRGDRRAKAVQHENDG